MTMKFKFGLDFCTVNLPTKFHHPTFNRSEVIVLTNKQTKRCCWRHPPGSAVLRQWKISQSINQSINLFLQSYSGLSGTTTARTTSCKSQ